jgi:hypothetical protein
LDIDFLGRRSHTTDASSEWHSIPDLGAEPRTLESADLEYLATEAVHEMRGNMYQRALAYEVTDGHRRRGLSLPFPGGRRAREVPLPLPAHQVGTVST